MATAVAMSLLCASAAIAAICGDGVRCACGDTVKGTAVLDADIGVCTGLGLLVSTGSVLDCAGHTVTGSDQPGAWYGIQLDGVSGSEVRDCRVTRFRRGIRIRGGGGNLVVGNEVFGNKYGIDVAGATVANRIENNAIHDNRDEGIHVGSGVNGLHVVGNALINNKYENLYLLSASGCTIAWNTLAQSRNAALYMKHSRNNYIADNELRDRPTHVRGASEFNRFERNRLITEGFYFQAYNDPSLGWTYPHDNEVVGGFVSTASYCFRFAGAYDNRVSGTVIDRCTPVLESELGGRAATGNVVQYEWAP